MSYKGIAITGAVKLFSNKTNIDLILPRIYSVTGIEDIVIDLIGVDNVKPRDTKYGELHFTIARKDVLTLKKIIDEEISNKLGDDVKYESYSIRVSE